MVRQEDHLGMHDHQAHNIQMTLMVCHNNGRLLEVLPRRVFQLEPYARYLRDDKTSHPAQEEMVVDSLLLRHLPDQEIQRR